MRRYWVWLLPFSVAATIVWLSSRPDYPFEVALPGPLDKVAHLAAFGVLAACTEIAWRHTHPDMPLVRRLIMIFIGVALFGASDELHQYFVPGRSCDFFDWLADAIGGGLGLLLVAWPGLRKRKED